MKRREFITLLGGGAAAWPLAAHAQRGKPALMGLLGSGTAAAQSEWTAAFVQRLRELGWSEGRNLTIEYRWAEGRSERFAEIAAEFVRLKIDVKYRPMARLHRSPIHKAPRPAGCHWRAGTCHNAPRKGASGPNPS